MSTKKLSNNVFVSAENKKDHQKWSFLIWSRWWDLNPQPPPYQGGALPVEATPAEFF